MGSHHSAYTERLQHGKRDWLKSAGDAAMASGHMTTAAPINTPGPRVDYFPNAIVRTHDGRKLRFYEDVVRGRVVVFNMMYAVCTVDCPGNTANLLRVQEALGHRLGKDIFMYSMTLHPEFDTPRALLDYVHRYHIKPGWTFLTGQPKQMEVIRRKLGFFDEDPVIDADPGSHTGMIRVGNETLDRWFSMPALSPPKDIARAILLL